MDQNFGLHSHIMENASSDLAEIREILESTRFILDGRKCSHILANYNSFFKLIFKQSRV